MERTIIVGDVHACHDELVELLDACALTAADRLISVGDVVDRGPDPGGVLALLRARANTVVVLGNHERKHVRGRSEPSILGYGQQVTRLQLGPGYADAVSWMSTLSPWYEDATVRVVHAGLVPGLPLSETPEAVLCGTTSGEERLAAWLGGERWTERYDDDVPVVFGHAVVGDEPLVVRDRVFGLDTGCCHGGWLTALVLPDRRFVRVRARADHWRETRRRWEVPVLAARPWDTEPFGRIRSKAGELGARHPDAAAWLAGLVGWTAAVEGAIPALAAHLDALVGGVADPVRDLAGHPAHATAVRFAKGRLGRASLGCDTPAAVFALADALGVALGVPRAPPTPAA